MAKKTRKRPADKKARPEKSAPETASKSTETEPENPFDFGGLPSRDLKKNLGCG
jgi:hypothetical protein